MEIETTSARVLSYVAENPGESTRAIAAGVRLNESTADYHLRRLAKEGRVVLEASARERRWYAARSGFCPVLRRAMPEMRRDESAAVLRCLTRTPATASEVARETGIAVGQVRWIVGKLENTLLLQKSRAGLMSLRDDAEVCREKTLRGEGCDQWGRCRLAQEWNRRLVVLATTKR